MIRLSLTLASIALISSCGRNEKSNYSSNSDKDTTKKNTETALSINDFALVEPIKKFIYYMNEVDITTYDSISTQYFHEVIDYTDTSAISLDKRIQKLQILINGENVKEVVFVQERDESKEIWNGARLGVEGIEKLGFEKVLSNKEFKNIELHLDRFDFITYSLPTESLKDNPFDKEDMYNLRQQFEAHLFKAEDATIKRGDYAVYMARLREVKTEEELVLIKRAINITCQAQTELLKALEPGMKEYQSEAVVEFIFKLNGAEYPGFPSIQGSGANSCVLHYQTNRKSMIGTNLLVSDVGAEYHGYTADVTRTMPVDGKFSKEEAEIYNLVLEAQNAGIEAAKVGNNFWEPNIAATTVLSQGLMKLGIIKTPAELKRYFMHGTSHYLGLDVHDQGTYGKLQENSVITVEPGLYIPENSPCDPKYWNIGVRIEDDILITKDGPENLSGCIPRTIPEIEQLMSQKSFISQ